MIIRKSAEEIEGMARAGRIVAETIALLHESLEPGITMVELDRIGDDYIHAQGGVPTSKGYKGFPAAICISPNSMVVHGIPGAYRAQEGDLISFDIGVTLDGLIADSAATFGVGEISPDAQRLLDVCQEALAAGIEAARPGQVVGDISLAVQTVVEGAGFSVIRSLVGHGVGRHYHEDPAGAELRLAAPRPGAPGGHDDRHRADDHGRRARGLHPRRRVVDLHDGRLARRAFRAHGRRDGRRPQDPHCDRGFGTMTTRAARRLAACALTTSLRNSA